MDINQAEISALFSDGDRQGDSSLSVNRLCYRSDRDLLLAVFAVMILTSLGGQLVDLPQTRIYESIICYQHYEHNDPSKINLPRWLAGPGALNAIDEKWCKVDVVQGDLAMLVGYQQLFEGVPGLLLAIPIGWAMDKFGRRPFMLLSLVQFVLSAAWQQIVAWNWQIFPIHYTWLSAAFYFLGGGSTVASTLIFVLISDVTPVRERANMFLKAGAASMSTNLLVSPLAAWMMQSNPWIPSLAGTASMTIAVVLYIPVPETLNLSNLGSTPTSRPSTPPANSRLLHQPVTTGASRESQLTRTTCSLTNDWRVLVLVLPFISNMLIMTSSRLMLQYISKRYDVSFAEGALLLTIRNGVQTVFLAVILPWGTAATASFYGTPDANNNIDLARVLQLILALGLILLASSPGLSATTVALALIALGSGAILLIRSFVTTLVKPDEIGKLYSVISFVDTIGAMAGAPLLACLFEYGLDLGNSWSGLPFLFLGVLSLLFAILLFTIRLVHN
jgi:MFS family permease